MAALTAEQRACILEAFLSASDMYAYCEPPKDPEWSSFYYDGYVTLHSLLRVASLVVEMMHQGDIGDIPVA
jgi:hypothetical protein